MEINNTGKHNTAIFLFRDENGKMWTVDNVTNKRNGVYFVGNSKFDANAVKMIGEGFDSVFLTDELVKELGDEELIKLV